MEKRDYYNWDSFDLLTEIEWNIEVTRGYIGIREESLATVNGWHIRQSLHTEIELLKRQLDGLEKIYNLAKK